MGEETKEMVTLPPAAKKRKRKISSGLPSKRSKFTDLSVTHSDENDDLDSVRITKKVKNAKKQTKQKGKKDKKEFSSKLKQTEVVCGEGEAAVTIYLTGLYKDTTQQDINKFFRQNNVFATEVRKLPKRGDAFVDLVSEADLERALALNGSQLKNSLMTVERAKSKKQTPAHQQKRSLPHKLPQNLLDKEKHSSLESPAKKQSDKNHLTLFVKNLPDDATRESLSVIFDEAVDIRIPQKGGVHLRYGFIEFGDEDTMEAAMIKYQGVEMDGHSLFLDYSGERSIHRKMPTGPVDKVVKGVRVGDSNKLQQGTAKGRGRSKILHVKDLSYSTNESSLRAAFPDAVAFRIPVFPDSGKSKGFAFIDFKTPEAAVKAYDFMNKKSIDGKIITLDFATSKGHLL